MTVGALAGCVLGGAGCVAALTALVCVRSRERRKRKQAAAALQITSAGASRVVEILSTFLPPPGQPAADTTVFHPQPQAVQWWQQGAETVGAREGAVHVIPHSTGASEGDGMTAVVVAAVQGAVGSDKESVSGVAFPPGRRLRRGKQRPGSVSATHTASTGTPTNGSSTDGGSPVTADSVSAHMLTLAQRPPPTHMHRRKSLSKGRARLNAAPATVVQRFAVEDVMDAAPPVPFVTVLDTLSVLFCGNIGRNVVSHGFRVYVKAQGWRFTCVWVGWIKCAFA